ncbi:S8 family peptidase [Streptomyces sp. B1866]|uniref:S8 family peptidase n=1 Tax=Streptomyces sp. B1866 TaxID=3075431 RepID=UPI00288CFB26|nr:S8 family peptidase [Streptomyces sp. B1866]MDT3397515.1 S8 family peptidase [Streptomyces sp. B1866]
MLAGLAALVAAGLATTATAAPPGGPAREAAGQHVTKQSRALGAGHRAHQAVTLITGDTVLVDGQGRVRGVRHGKGRERVPISVQRAGGHSYAVPRDAERLIARGAVDRRLFDVAGLLRAGYDDAHRRDTPLIVAYGGGRQRSAVRAELTGAGASVRRDLPAVRGAAVTAPKSGGSRVWEALTGGRGRAAAGIARVWLDGRVRASLDKSVPQIGAPEAWKAGYDGKGVKVAVLDTGVDQTHPDLAGQEVAEKNFSEAPDSVDRFGHGTHVASIVAGTGAKSGGKYRGVASGARILDGKVLDDGGSGSYSGIIAGMQWAVDQGAKVVNLSLGGWDTPEIDPLEQAVDDLSGKGTLFVVAAGNAGPDAESLNSPGTADAALTVGAVDRDDQLAFFSSRGPRQGDGAIKPDITAPGVDIVAAKAAEGQIGDPAADGYESLSGTSMATPHVPGSAALLAQQHPDWTGQRLKQALTASAKPTPGLSPYEQGSGRVDVAKVIKQTVVGEQTSLGFGIQAWPHDDDQPVTRKLTYRNTAADPVTLDLSVQGTGPDGAPAAGVFTLGTGRLTVPAHGTAEADIVADTRAGTKDGVYSGAVTATAEGGGESVRTPVAVTREDERYDLTLRYGDATGRPGPVDVTVVGYDVSYYTDVTDDDQDGTVTLRVPKGHYTVNVQIDNPSGDPENPNLAWMVSPYLTVAGDTTATYDARQAKPVTIKPPDSRASIGRALGLFDVTGEEAAGFYEFGTEVNDFRHLTTAQVGDSAPKGHFESVLEAVWTLPGEQNPHTVFNSVFNRADGFFTGFSHQTRMSEFARADITVGAPAPGRSGYVLAEWLGPFGGLGIGLYPPLPLPGTWKEYVSAPRGYRWAFLAWELGDEDSFGINLDGPPRVLRPGQVTRDTFNVGVFGPVQGTGSRKGDEIGVCLPTFSDGAGHPGDPDLLEGSSSALLLDGRTLDDEQGAACVGTGGLPPEARTYELRTDIRPDPTLTSVSTRVTGKWTFTSAASEEEALVPLSAVRFTPKLSLTSTAPAGRELTVPVVLDGPAARQAPKELTVEVSYDEGVTWRSLPVRTQGGKRSVTVDNPAAGGSVSFRAHLTERDGDTVDETIYRAYTTLR